MSVTFEAIWGGGGLLDKYQKKRKKKSISLANQNSRRPAEMT